MRKPTAELIAILETLGPLTGKELLKQTGADEFSLWSMCSRPGPIVTRIIGKRYLRLDRHVEAYARLSPSIMREFYGYTVIGTVKNLPEIPRKAALLQKEIADISKKKFLLARDTMTKLVEAHRESEIIKSRASFMIAGDVVYGMAHAEPRPEPSTGELVKGSDLDIIVVSENLPQHIMESLESAIYAEKHNLLTNPACREELDYIVKDISRVQDQLQFSDFKAIVASKILHEARFLYGSADIFGRVRILLEENGIPEKLLALEKKARVNRENAVSYLLTVKDSPDKEEFMKLFHTNEELEEIF